MYGWQSSDLPPPLDPPLYPPIQSYPPPAYPPTQSYPPPPQPYPPPPQTYPPTSPSLPPFLGDPNSSHGAGYTYPPPIPPEAAYPVPYPPLPSEYDAFAPPPLDQHRHHYGPHDHQHSFGGQGENPRIHAYDHSWSGVTDQEAPNPYGQIPQEEAYAYQSHGSGYGASQYQASPYSEEGYGAKFPKSSQPSVVGPVVKVFCKANTDFNLGVRHDGVVMVKQNIHDESQQWILDQSWSTRVKDSTGQPAFMLINKASNKALKHATEAAQQVLLTNYDPGAIDESILWTHSEEMGGGFRTIRMANNILLNLHVLKGDRKSGGVREGAPTILFKWTKQENQLWKITPL